MKMHLLKINSIYYEQVMFGRKKAELRKNDRDFKVGDLIHFTRIDGSEYEELNMFIITHILPVRDIMPDSEDYVMLSIDKYCYGDPRNVYKG